MTHSELGSIDYGGKQLNNAHTGQMELLTRGEGIFG